MGSRIAKLRKIKGFLKKNLQKELTSVKERYPALKQELVLLEFKTIEKIANELELGPAELFNFCEEYSEKRIN